MSKASDIQVGGDHYKTLPIQPSEFCQKNQLNWCESNAVKYVTRHRQKHGRQDIEKAIHYLQLLLEWEYPSAAAMNCGNAEAAPPVVSLLCDGCTRQYCGLPLEDRDSRNCEYKENDFDASLPAITLLCTVEEAVAKYHSEVNEWHEAEEGSISKMIELWDVQQAYHTFRQRSNFKDINNSIGVVSMVPELERLHNTRFGVLDAKKLMLIKNAVRGYYAKEVNEIILATLGERFKP